MVFLRKKRRSTVSVTTRSELGHSLSLPDLTTPLIDEASWEELPAFAKVLPSMSNTIGKSQGKHHTLGIVTSLASAQSQTEFGALGYSSPARVSGTHIAPRQSATVSGPVTITPSAPAITSSPSRNRSPSLISAKGAGSPIAFHRPFRGDNVFSPPLTAPPVPSYTFPHGADFRKSAAGWSVHGHGQAGEMEGDGFSTIGSVRPHSMSGRRKRGKGKAVQERLNVIIAGGRGAGKTSLIRLLSSEPPKDPSPNHSHSQDPTSASPLTTDTQTPSSPTSPGPPLPISLPGAASSLSSPLNLPTTKRLSVKRLSNPAPVLNEPAPTQRLSSHQALIPQPHLQRNLAVRFIDTPGLDVQEDDGPAVHAYIRERGVGSLLGLVEQQCEGVLREESRVIRRGTAGADELVHLCLYLIDARRVLHSATTHIEPDWSFQGLFINDDNALSPVKSTNTARPVSSITIQPHIPSADMQTIRSLKKRMTVLPVLTYADCLSQPELASVKEAVRRDMAAAFPDEEGAGFGLFGATEDAQEPDSPVIGIHHTPNPPTPALTETSIIAESEMPYAIFCPSVSVLQSNTDGDGSAAGTRDFAWGQAKVWDGDHSDLMKLRESIFEVNTKALKVHTRQVLYERFRTERLLAHRARRGIPEE